MRSFAVLLAALLFLAPSVALADTTIYLVRHAEKVDSKDKDPALTKAGAERAKTLAEALRSVPLKAVYTTPYVRNVKTAEPTAKQAGIKATVLPGDGTDDLVKRLRTAHDGQHVLVVGHSNTVPKILTKLGVKPPVTLGHDDYDNLFVVHLGKNGVTVSQLHFGRMTR